MTFPRSRILLALLLMTLTGALVAPAASQADAGSGTSAAAAKKRKLSPRKGGTVRKAWPAKKSRGNRPRKQLARFLAKQVGPTKVAKRRKVVARSSAVIQEFLPAAKPSALRLVRSFDVPAGDPDAARMANLSWTYDSALAAVALMFAGDKVQAEQLLDQLAALQRTDGSIDFAFNVTNGASLQQFRTGSISWIGLAAATYGNLYGSSRYDALAGGAARYVLARKQSSGLLAGGPDVSWVSTQHNLIAWFFLSSLDDDINTGMSESNLEKAVDGIADGIERNLITSVNSSHSAFVQGVGDPIRPLDVQTFGLLFLEASGKSQTTANKVRAYLGSAYPVSGRSIVKSSDPLSFNQTYSATGPFSGYRPYADGAGPDVLWAEGTAQVRYALRALGEKTTTLDSTISAWNAVSSTGPLGADRRDTSREINGYHVWPTSAAASWTLLGTGYGTTVFGN